MRVANKSHAKRTHTQTGNHVRAEGSVKIDDNNRVWATKTMNDDNAIGCVCVWFVWLAVSARPSHDSEVVHAWGCAT